MYDPTIWSSWKEQELKNYQTNKDQTKTYNKKGYLHLDDRFWFPERFGEIEEILKNNLQTKNRTTKLSEYYSFLPFLRLVVKTPRYRYQFLEGIYDLETKKRPLCYAAHRDSLILGYYAYALSELYEKYIKEEQFDDVVLAYRKELGKCNIQFAKEVFDLVKARKECSVIALDIKGYFDHIDHEKLLEKWKRVYRGKLPEDQYRLWNLHTTYSYINQSSLLKAFKGPKKRNSTPSSNLLDTVPGESFIAKIAEIKKRSLIVKNNIPNSNTKRLCGIPQGSPMSAILSNIFLIDFDADLKKQGIEENFIYRRYCDDILIICNTSQAFKIMNDVINKIKKEYFLTIQTKKVELIDFMKNSNGKIRAFGRPRKTKRKLGEPEVVVISENPAKITPSNEEKHYKSLQYLGFEYNGKNILIRSSSLSRYYWKLNYRLQRTVIMSYSPKSKDDQIYLDQIYERYSHLGERNFLTYAYKAASKEYKESDGQKKEGLNSPAIRNQLKNHFSILHHELGKKNLKWFKHKQLGNKKVSLRYFG